MARKTFFSFYYEKDIWRAGQVRNSWVTQGREAAGFWDAASWEEVKKKGEEAIKRWIDKQIEGTSVTVVLIGAETNGRKYVIYELERSHKKGNGMLGIYIHNMKDSNGNTDKEGKNTFGKVFPNEKGEDKYFWELYPTYNWIRDDGYKNMGNWIESAAKKAGK